jgi:hypothetical protein
MSVGDAIMIPVDFLMQLFEVLVHSVNSIAVSQALHFTPEIQHSHSTKAASLLTSAEMAQSCIPTLYPATK